jgi:hypothetical protein
MRRFLVAMSAVIVILSPVRATDASATAQPDGCPTDKPKVVDAYDTFENVADLGADGHVWALDEGTQHIQMWRTGTNSYCVMRHDVGTFTSFAGVSPEGTGTISADVTGTFDGTVYLRIHGRFAPTLPTSGFIGHFDAQCQQDGSCLGTEPRVSALYFSRVNAFDFGWFTFKADGGSHGTWVQTPSGNTGDITG